MEDLQTGRVKVYLLSCIFISICVTSVAISGCGSCFRNWRRIISNEFISSPRFSVSKFCNWSFSLGGKYGFLVSARKKIKVSRT